MTKTRKTRVRKIRNVHNRESESDFITHRQRTARKRL